MADFAARLAAMKQRAQESKQALKSQEPAKPQTPVVRPAASSRLIPQKAIETSRANTTVPTFDPELFSIPPEMQELGDFDVTDFMSKLQGLITSVEAKAPDVKTYMRRITHNLNQYPELVHLLNDKQLAALASGFFFLTDMQMAEAVTSGKSRKKLTIDELQSIF